MYICTMEYCTQYKRTTPTRTNMNTSQKYNPEFEKSKAQTNT